MQQLNFVKHNARYSFTGNVIDKNIFCHDPITVLSYKCFLTFKVGANFNYRHIQLFYRITANNYIQIAKKTYNILHPDHLISQHHPDAIQLEYQCRYDKNIPFEEFVYNYVLKRIEYYLFDEGYPIEPISPYLNKQKWKKIFDFYYSQNLPKYLTQLAHPLLQNYIKDGLNVTPINIFLSEWAVEHPQDFYKKILINLDDEEELEAIPHYSENLCRFWLYTDEENKMQEWYYQFRNCALYSNYRFKLCHDYDYHLNMKDDFFDFVDLETFLKDEVNAFPLFISSPVGYLPFSPKNDPRLEGKVICILVRHEIRHHEKCIFIYKIKNGQFQFYRNMTMLENDSLEEKWERYNEMTVTEHFQASMNYFKNPYYCDLYDVFHVVKCN